MVHYTLIFFIQNFSLSCLHRPTTRRTNGKLPAYLAIEWQDNKESDNNYHNASAFGLGYTGFKRIHN